MTLAFYRMGDAKDCYPRNPSNRQPSQFAVYHTVLLYHRVWIVKDLNGIIEADPVLPQIALGLCLVPLK